MREYNTSLNNIDLKLLRETLKLNKREIETFFYIQAKGKVSIKELYNQICVDRTTMSKVVKELHEKKFVIREKDISIYRGYRYLYSINPSVYTDFIGTINVKITELELLRDTFMKERKEVQKK